MPEASANHLFTTGLGLLVVLLVAWTVFDYFKWLDFGQGAPPNSCHPRGYLTYQAQKWYLRLVHRVDVCDATELRQDEDKRSFLDFFGKNSGMKGEKEKTSGIIGHRSGPRPRMVPWILPQRIAPPYGPDSSPEDFDLHTLLADVVVDWQLACTSSPDDSKKRLANIPFIGLSRLEGHGASILLTPNATGILPCEASQTLFSEVSHIHMQDRSFHVVLSPADAATVVERQRGERFAIAGRHMWIGRLKGRKVPAGYILAYTPRNVEEIHAVKRIITAAIAFALS